MATKARLEYTSHITAITRNEGTLGKLATYAERHERPYTLRVPNGKGVLEIRWYEGYISIYSRQPGVMGFEQEIHITRKTWFKLLWYEMRKIKQVTKLMEGPSFDRYRAERRYYREEREQLEALRAQKAERRGPRRRRRRV